MSASNGRLRRPIHKGVTSSSSSSAGNPQSHGHYTVASAAYAADSSSSSSGGGSSSRKAAASRSGFDPASGATAGTTAAMGSVGRAYAYDRHATAFSAELRPLPHLHGTPGQYAGRIHEAGRARDARPVGTMHTGNYAQSYDQQKHHRQHHYIQQSSLGAGLQQPPSRALRRAQPCEQVEPLLALAEDSNDDYLTDDEGYSTKVIVNPAGSARLVKQHPHSGVLPRPSSTASLLGAADKGNLGIHENGASASRERRVKVVVRCRPAFEDEVSRPMYRQIVDIQQQPPPVSGQPRRLGDGQDLLTLDLLEDGNIREFGFDKCFPNVASQAKVFDTCARPVIDEVFEGFHGSVLAYGQTGTGKTYTMGLLESSQDLLPKSAQERDNPSFIKDRVRRKGIIPQSLYEVFDRIRRFGSSREVVVKMSFLQVYLDSVYDLFCEAGSVESTQSLKVREGQGGFYAHGLAEYEVESFPEAIELLEWGLQNRVFSSTYMNITSSRSHTVLFLRVFQKVFRGPGAKPTNDSRRSTRDSKRRGPSNGAVAHTISATLALVDLAGSERIRRTGSTGTALNEAKAINSSLAALGNVVSALADDSRPHIPYRDHKLTKILADCIGGSANTVFITTIGPSDWDYNETLSTLSFASRCMNIRAAPIQNRIDTAADQSELVQKLKTQLMESQDEVQRLKAQVHEWQSTAASWKHEYEQQYQALRRANAANAAAVTATAGSARKHVAFNNEGATVQDQRVVDIGRPLRRVMSQMFEFYDATLARTKVSLLQFLNGSGAHDPKHMDSAPAVTASFIARSWKQLYADEKDRSPSRSARSSLVQMASALVLKHRACFPTLTSENCWCWTNNETNLISSKPFHELVVEAVEMEKAVAAKEAAITQHQILLQDILAFHDRVSARHPSQPKSASHPNAGHIPQLSGEARTTHATSTKSENEALCPSQTRTSTVVRQQSPGSNNAIDQSPRIPHPQSPRFQEVAPLVVSLDMTLDDGLSTIASPPAALALRPDLTPERDSAGNTRTTGRGSKSAAKATEFVSPVERAKIPVPTLQPSLRSAPEQVLQKTSTSHPDARLQPPLSNTNPADRSARLPKPRDTTAQHEHGRSIGQHTPRLTLKLEDSEVTDLTSVASPSPDTDRRSSGSEMHSQPLSLNSVVSKSVASAEPGISASTTSAPIEGTPSPKPLIKQRENDDVKAPSSPQDIIESLKWQVRNRLENLKLSMAETHAHAMAQQAKSASRRSTPPTTAASSTRSGFDALIQRTPPPVNITLDNRPGVSDRSPQSHSQSSGIDDVDHIEAIVGVRTKRVQLLSGEVNTVIQYKVHWENSDPSEDEWFNRDDLLQDFPDTVHAHEKQRRQRLGVSASTRIHQ